MNQTLHWVRPAFSLFCAVLFITACGDKTPPAGKGETTTPTAVTATVKPAVPATGGPVAKAPQSCYDIGVLVGRCAAKSMSNQPCLPSEEIPMPAECKGKPETDKGLADGRNSVY